MNARRLAALSAVALLVIAAAVWLSSQRHLERAVVSGEPILADLKQALNSVTEVHLAKSDGTRTTLKKSGGDWMVTERNFLADAGRVRKLLLDAAALEVVEEKTSDPTRYDALSVEDVDLNALASAPAPAKEAYDSSKPPGAARIDIVTPARTWSLVCGKSSGAKSGYVRVVGAKRSFLATPRLDVDTEPQRWLEHTIVDVPQARIQSVQVQPAKGPAYTVSRAQREQDNFTVSPVPKRRKLADAGAGNALARGLESVSLDDVQPKPDAVAASTPAKTLERSHATFHTFDGMTVDVAGRKESSPGLKKDDPKVEKFFITLTAASNDKATQAEAQTLSVRVTGREFEISSYKYEGIFKPLEELLEALPAVTKTKAKGKSP